jgi:hypothetical protein
MKTEGSVSAISRMDPKQRAALLAELDREFVADSFGQPDATARARWKRARRKPGRPVVGKGVKVISVSLEKDLLEQSDRLARRLGVSRAHLISRGLRAVLAAAGSR